MTASPCRADASGPVRDRLLALVQERTRTAVSADTDLFASGLVSSLYAVELLTAVERSFGITSRDRT
ncbi:phosphopantetheine-binding protein [Streptomyces sp. NPDC002851]